MIVVRFKVTARPDRTDALRDVLTAVVAPSRALDGVLSFDIAQDVCDPCSFIATEVFADAAALARQEELAEVERVVAMLPDVAAADPEATVYEVSSSRPWG